MDFEKLREAEQALATATTPEQIDIARALLKTALYRKRRQAQQSHGVLAQSLHTALDISRKMKADGASEQERHEYIEGVVRTVWPRRRSQSWKFTCDDCSDTGLILMECTPDYRCDGLSSRADAWNQPPGKYQRLCTKDASHRHAYGMPCHCARGDAFRLKVKQRKSLDDAGTPSKRKMVRI